MIFARMGSSVALAMLALSIGCRERAATGPLPDPHARFAGYTKTCSGIPGEIPNDYLAAQTNNDPKLIDGLCTWYLWQGGDPSTYNGKPDTGGDPFFWRALEKKTADIEATTHEHVVFTLLEFIDSRGRDRRFADLGLINDPGCRKSATADAYGLYLDRCDDPYASGVIGLRLSPNPKFDRTRWNAAEFFEDPRKYEPPYLVGMTCGACHIAFNPIAPPADPVNPKWENLAGSIGNQYLREGRMFQGDMTPADFLWHMYETQQPGTSDTSRLSLDWIDNPNTINGIYSLTSARPTHVETMNDGTTRAVPHILKDGADSIGAVGAALRVYVNIGTCGAMRMAAEDVLTGVGKDQSPFVIKTAEAQCQDFQQTMARIPNAAAFLDSQHGFKLPPQYIDASQLALGRRMFAENCARCHSSFVPPGLDERTKHDPANKAKWVDFVNRPDFLVGNFLSDDKRYPVVCADWRFNIGTNIKRTMGTNAGAGHIWQDFSSRTYKELKSPGAVTLYNPIDPSKPIRFTIPDGHGYYRPPSLIAVWASAPLLHNNSVGKGTSDPSIAGRLDAFHDAMTKMFNPALRDGEKSIKRTSRDSTLQVGVIKVRIPKGTPIDLLANVNLRAFVKQGKTAAIRDVVDLMTSSNQGEKLLAVNAAPDFIEDHGHYFGSRLKPEEQRALIEFLKTF